MENEDFNKHTTTIVDKCLCVIMIFCLSIKFELRIEVFKSPQFSIVVDMKNEELFELRNRIYNDKLIKNFIKRSL